MALLSKSCLQSLCANAGGRALLAADGVPLLAAVVRAEGRRAYGAEDDAQQRPLSQDPAVQQARKQQQQQAAGPAGAERAQRYRSTTRCSLSSINDPENYGLAGLGSSLGGGEGFYWLGPNSLSNPEYRMPLSSLRSSSLSPLPTKGFSTAKTQPTVQRIIFRSSMADPAHPLIDSRLAAEDEDSAQQK